MQDILMAHYDDMTQMYHTIGLKLGYLEKFRDEFETYKQQYFPQDTVLTYDLAEGWIHNTRTQSKVTLGKRVQAMKRLGIYQRSLGKDAYIPDYSIRQDPSPEPYLFNDGQLFEFFVLADSIPCDYRSPNREILFPVIFRLMYCCGLRSSEACCLSVDDVDFSSGILSIYHSKGNRDRIVYMDDEVTELCLNFHRYYSGIMPDREYFFQPSWEKKHYTALDVGNTFRGILHRTSFFTELGKMPTPHGLRHLFAVKNLQACLEQNKDFNNWIQYLGQYMGHSRLRDTLYYVHMVSQLFPVYQDKLAKLTEGIGVVYVEE